MRILDDGSFIILLLYVDDVDVDVDDVIVMMYVVHVHEGYNDQVGCPWWGNRVIKEF